MNTTLSTTQTTTKTTNSDRIAAPTNQIPRRTTPTKWFAPPTSLQDMKEKLTELKRKLEVLSDDV